MRSRRSNAARGRDLALAQRWLAALLLVACSADYPEGKLVCSSASECPAGWSCVERGNGSRCYSAPSASDRDAAATGSGGGPNGRKDGGPSADSGASTDSGPNTDAGSNTDSGPSTTDSGPSTDGGPGADGGSSSDGAIADGGDAAQAEPDAGPEPGCVPAPADPALGIFVSPAGSTVANCGSAASPCSTIAQGMARARATNRALVYVDAGTYGESVVLLAGLTLRGGWDNIAGEWTRKCTADRAASAVIASPAEIGVLAEFDGEAALDTLTIRSKPLASASESTYAVFARGAGTRLVLDEVIAVAGAAGHGAAGAAGPSAAAATGSCSPGSGANGAAEGSLGPGAARGVFYSAGFSRGDGMRGGTGASGGHGALAGTPLCADCSGCEGSEGGPICIPIGQSCGEAGASGCGGAGGAGGDGGYGGGSSIALFVWDATVIANRGRLEAGRGGDGGPGGVSGMGGAGSVGVTPPPPAECATCIGAPGDCFGFGNVRGVSTAGGNGGGGSPGGTGGGGAGGFSYALYKGGAASVTIASTTELAHAAAGAGANNGASGLAAAVGP